MSLGWVAAGAMLLLCLLRLDDPDGNTYEIAALSVLPWLLLPSLPLTALAGWRRQWPMAAAAALSLIGGLVWEAPVMWPWSTAPTAGPAGRIIVFDANIAQNNLHPSQIAAEIESDRPNLVALEELTPQALTTLQDSGALSGYRWHVWRPQTGAGGVGVWSNLPMTQPAIWTLNGYQFEASGWIHPTGGVPALRFDAVHVLAPVGVDQPARWRRQLGTVRAHLSREPRPLLVMGDFNATADERPFQQILSEHLSDAAVMAGKGWEMTWPRNQSWVIPYLRIDHVLLSPTLTVTGYRLGQGKGSDHYPLVVGIGFRR